MTKYYHTEQSPVVVFWQEPKEPYTIGEPAICMKAYSDCLSITQGDKGKITITLECVPEFIKAIKQAMAE